MRTVIVGTIILAATLWVTVSMNADSNPTANTDLTASNPTPGSREEFIRVIGDRVFSAFDRFDIGSEGRATLKRQAEWLRKYSNVTVQVEGHCDEPGTREYNLALGARRANAVKEYLVSQRIGALRISTVSYGKERPMCVEAMRSCWARNRCTIIVVVSGTACKDCRVLGRKGRTQAATDSPPVPKQLFGLETQRN